MTRNVPEHNLLQINKDKRRRQEDPCSKIMPRKSKTQLNKKKTLRWALKTSGVLFFAGVTEDLCLL